MLHPAHYSCQILDPDFDELEPICGVQANAWDDAAEFFQKKKREEYEKLRWKEHQKRERERAHKRAEAYREEQEKKKKPVYRWWWYEWS